MGVRWLAVLALLLGASCKKDEAKRAQLPPPPDATIDYQSGRLGTPYKSPAEVVAQVELNRWSVGLSKAIQLVAHLPDPTHPPYCATGEALHDRIKEGIDGGAGCAATKLAGPAAELELECTFRLPDPDAAPGARECDYVYRARLWTELDAGIDNKYRLLATSWVQKRVCEGPNTGAVASAPARAKDLVSKTGTGLNEVIEPCRRKGSP